METTKKLRGREKTYACEDCGVTVTRRRQSNQRLICLDCAVYGAATSARQLAAKSGPAWDHWKEGQLRFAERLRSGPGAA